MAGDVLPGPPRALPFVLAQGVPTQLRMVGASMEPTLQRGAVLQIVPVATSVELEPGEVVVIASRQADEVIVHRVLLTFVEAGGRFVVHQGDAPGTAFCVASRQQVLARVVTVNDRISNRARPVEPGNPGRFALRRLLCIGYLAGRRVTRALRHATDRRRPA